MENLEQATWVLTVLTGVLALSTIAYTYVTYLSYKGSKDQIKALNNLSTAILEVPKITMSMQTSKETAKKMADERSKQMTDQQRAVRGR